MPPTRSAQSSISLANILFATDFSRQSSLALKHALPIARKYGSKIYAAHVTCEQIGLPASAREGVKRAPVQLEVASHLPVGTAYAVVSLATCPVLTVRR